MSPCADRIMSIYNFHYSFSQKHPATHKQMETEALVLESEWETMEEETHKVLTASEIMGHKALNKRRNWPK